MRSQLSRAKTRAENRPQRPQQDPPVQRRRWETSTRYYEAILCRDLFDLVLIRCNGGRGSRLGRVRVTPGTPTELVKLMQQTAKLREKHGYREVLCIGTQI